MTCDVYQRLQREWKSAEAEWARLARPSKELPRQSERKARKLAAEAKRKRDNASKRMRWHLAACLDCK
jgi:hypothetical protein